MEIIAREGVIGSVCDTMLNLSNPAGEAAESETGVSEQSSQSATVPIQKPIIVKLYRCFGCERSFALIRMSSCLSVCRDCLRKFRTCGSRLEGRFLDRTIARIRDFLRRTA